MIGGMRDRLPIVGSGNRNATRYTIADERAGSDMLYSSGTTGRPKGIRPGAPRRSRHHRVDAIAPRSDPRFGFGADTVYLCPPRFICCAVALVHGGPRLGGTIVLMEQFVPEEALALIERYRISASQWVPTHLIRMLKLPEEVRARTISVVEVAIHAAAPCRCR